MSNVDYDQEIRNVQKLNNISDAEKARRIRVLMNEKSKSTTVQGVHDTLAVSIKAVQENQKLNQEEKMKQIKALVDARPKPNVARPVVANVARPVVANVARPVVANVAHASNPMQQKIEAIQRDNKLTPSQKMSQIRALIVQQKPVAAKAAAVNVAKAAVNVTKAAAVKAAVAVNPHASRQAMFEEFNKRREQIINSDLPQSDKNVQLIALSKELGEKLKK